MDKYASRYHGRKIFFVCQHQCFCLESHNGFVTTSSAIESLFSDQEEADTRIILHCLHVCQTAAPKTSITVRSPDTDVLIELIYYSSVVQLPLYFDTGFGKKRRLIDVQSIADKLGPDLSEALPAFHAFTGCDYTSAFVRRGKIRPLQLLRQHPQFVSIFKHLGSSATLDNATFDEVQHFVCCNDQGN